MSKIVKLEAEMILGRPASKRRGKEKERAPECRSIKRKFCLYCTYTIAGKNYIQLYMFVHICMKEKRRNCEMNGRILYTNRICSAMQQPPCSASIVMHTSVDSMYTNRIIQYIPCFFHCFVVSFVDYSGSLLYR